MLSGLTYSVLPYWSEGETMFMYGAETPFNKVKQSKALFKSRKQRQRFLSFTFAKRNTSPAHTAWLTPSKDLGHSHQALVVNKTGH